MVRMPPKATSTKQGRLKASEKAKASSEEENIFREPEGSSSEDDHSADIKPTVFSRTLADPKFRGSKSNAGSRGKNTTKVTTNRSSRSTYTRPAGGKVSPGSSEHKSSSKRKNRDESKILGSSMTDEFGIVNIKKAKTFKTRKSIIGGMSGLKELPKLDSAADEDSPKRSFRTLLSSSPLKSDVEEEKVFKPWTISQKSSAASTPRSHRNFRTRQLSSTPVKKNVEENSMFKTFDIEIDDFFEASDVSLDSSLFKHSEQPSVPKQVEEKVAIEEFPATQRPGFKTYEFDDGDLIESAQSLVNRGGLGLSPFTTSSPEHDSFSLMTQRACCPMCNKPVDPEDLRAYGDMNVRMQEKFCRLHRKKTAREDWVQRGYPKIDWEKLDSRISKHHTFIRKLINGGNSHYRETYVKTTSAGKDRTLLKMTTNLTPGYYGGRGLRVISENIMHEFTPLLKKRAVLDRLISARGTTPYVQSVLVPEVAVLLVMEDMAVKEEEAREILTDSVGFGELLNEEIMDVVTREVEDSEDEDGLCDE